MVESSLQCITGRLSGIIVGDYIPVSSPSNMKLRIRLVVSNIMFLVTLYRMPACGTAGTLCGTSCCLSAHCVSKIKQPRMGKRRPSIAGISLSSSFRSPRLSCVVRTITCSLSTLRSAVASRIIQWNTITLFAGSDFIGGQIRGNIVE